MSWLEPPVDEDEASDERKSDPVKRGASDSPKRPSRPVPQRRETMDVRLEWLEPEPAESEAEADAAKPKRRRSSVAIPAAKPKRTRQPWEPPTLPPPPANAVKSRRVLPPPLPREDVEDTRKRPSRRPQKT